MRRTPEEREALLRRLHGTLTAQVETLTTSDGWQAMLKAAARFHRYSPANVLLIAAQRPDATYVAGIHTWNSLRRHVRRGERGIAILAPRLSRGTDTARSAGARGDVSPAEEAEPGERVLRGFRVVHVFDIAQTEGEPMPIVEPRRLEGKVAPQLWERLATVAENAGYTIERGDCGTANGWIRFDTRTIRVRDDVSDEQAVRTLTHELGHVFADHRSRFVGPGSQGACRGAAEVEAESIAYLVLAGEGIDTGDYSVPYVAGWAGGDLTLIKETMVRAIEVAAGLGRRLPDHPRLPGARILRLPAGACEHTRDAAVPFRRGPGS